MTLGCWKLEKTDSLTSVNSGTVPASGIFSANTEFLKGVQNSVIPKELHYKSIEIESSIKREPMEV